MLTVDSVLHSSEFDKVASELAACGRFLAECGWSPGTSSNYSARFSSAESAWIAISRSGVDKYNMSAGDFMVVASADASNGGPTGFTGADFKVVAPTDARPSAETQIHTAIYAARPRAGAILHTHSPNNTRLSLKFLDQGELVFKGYEMQKGLDGVSHHDRVVRVPILPNSQDMTAFSKEVTALLAREPDIHGFLIAGHGLYTWASTVAAAKRHIETFEFLFSCHVLELMGV